MRKIINKIILYPRSTASFIKKDFLLLFRKKKYLYLTIALPLIIGLIYILTLTSGFNNVNIKVCDFDNTTVTKQAINDLNDFDATISHSETCIKDMIEDVKFNKYLFGIVIEKGFSKSIENLKQSKMQVYYDNSEPAITELAQWRIDAALVPFKYKIVESLAKEIKEKSTDAKEKTQLAIKLSELANIPNSLTKTIKDADADFKKLSELEVNFITSPIKTENHGVHKEYKLIDIGISPLYVVLSLFIILMLCSTGIIYDRKIHLFSRIRASNSSMFSYISAKLIFFLGLSIAQLLLLIIIFKLFGANYSISYLNLIKTVLFISLVNSFLGILIGLISDSEGVSVLISLIITLPMMFLSGMFYPVQLMPSTVKIFTEIIPIRAEIMMMKKAMLFGGQIQNEYFLIPLGLLILSLYLIKKTK